MTSRAVLQPTAQRCTYCREVKAGRYRAPSELATRSGHGWTQGRQSVHWICGDCDRAQVTAKPELCPNCKGNGVTWQHVEGGYLEKVTCGDCWGRGNDKKTA